MGERPNAIPALLALTRLVGRAFASEHMLQRVGGRAARLLVDWEDLADRYGLPSECGDGERVWLGLDPVVAFPWSTSRLIENLERLSLGPPGGPCDAELRSYDSFNHYISLWLPMRLAEVGTHGYHSVVAGVLSNTGSVRRDPSMTSRLFSRDSIGTVDYRGLTRNLEGPPESRIGDRSSIRTGPPIARSWLQRSFSGLRAGREQLTTSPNFLATGLRLPASSRRR